MLGSNGEPTLHSDFDEDDMDMRDIMKTSFYDTVMRELNQLGQQGLDDSSSINLDELGEDGEYHARRIILEQEVREKICKYKILTFNRYRILKSASSI
jgi:hypothetical protein